MNARKELVFKIGTIAVGLLLIIGVLEIGLRVYFDQLAPTYEVLYVEPEPVIGWKLTPDLEFTWTGTNVDCMEFRAPVQVNAEGFRDLDRDLEKPDNVVRVALLGDSLVETLQVPFDQTAGQVLE